MYVYVYIYGFLVCRYARSLGLTARQNTPALDAAIYYPNGTLYQLQLSFHTYSTEPEPTAHGVFAGDGAPSGPNCTLFSGAERLLEVSRGRLGGG